MSTTCPACSAPLVEITLNVNDDEMTMASCSHCDKRSWRGRRDKVTIDRVLDAVHDDRDRVRGRRSARTN